MFSVAQIDIPKEAIILENSECVNLIPFASLTMENLPTSRKVTRKIKELEGKVVNIKNELNKQTDQKVENFEKKTELLQKDLNAKDSEITELKKQILSIENTLDKKTKELKTIIEKEQDKSDSMIKYDIEKAGTQNPCEKEPF